MTSTRDERESDTEADGRRGAGGGVSTRLAGPWVWRAADLQADARWQLSLAPAEAAELRAALAAVQASGRPLEQVRRHDFAVPGLQQRFRAIARELEQGRGFVLVRGTPVDGLTDDECQVLFWGIGLQLGLPLSQSRHQNYIAEVKDIGEQMGQATSRAYRAGGPLRFHTDQCDVLGLLCIREPISGGLSRVVSSAAVHNAILERRPDLLRVLYEPFAFSRQGEEVAGEMPWYPRPIFEFGPDGAFTSQFSMSFIESAQRMADVPRLTAAQQEALALVTALAEELSTTIELRRGDMQFFNNHVVYHSRTDYQDHAEIERRRTQLRLWLATPGSRALPPAAAVLFGDTGPGAVRGGVTPPSGRRFCFPGWTDAGWNTTELDEFRA